MRSSRAICSRSPLNEGRGANPGDTRAAGRGGSRRRPLNEGRGANPGDTPGGTGEIGPEHPRSTKAGARTPATRGRNGAGRAPRRPLNEGRGANPGDTKRAPASAPGASVAQRRPGREPRRHHRLAELSEVGDLRSTKAGARTPATPAVRTYADSDFEPLNEGRGANPGDTTSAPVRAPSQTPAQRRPGREPRRHLELRRVLADDGSVAQRRPGREPRRHSARRRPAILVGVRSTKAGARTPATPAARSRRCWITARAQRRPGREPRRHSTAATRSRLASRSAQRRPGREPRRHAHRGRGHVGGQDRSTKAGARTPATHGYLTRRQPCAYSLNEGRGANPGDTPA